MNEQELSLKEILAQAQDAEKSKDSRTAVELYNSVLKTDDLNVNAYDRLMKIYRQLKEYKKELMIINKGIKAYEKLYKSERKTRSKKINDISQKLNRSFGLIDKKGNNIYDPEPIGRWKKRKLNVEKKVK
jgi:hypothetical protein